MIAASQMGAGGVQTPRDWASADRWWCHAHKKSCAAGGLISIRNSKESNAPRGRDRRCSERPGGGSDLWRIRPARTCGALTRRFFSSSRDFRASGWCEVKQSMALGRSHDSERRFVFRGEGGSKSLVGSLPDRRGGGTHLFASCRNYFSPVRARRTHRALRQLPYSTTFRKIAAKFRVGGG